MADFSLVAHRDTPDRAIRSIAVCAARAAGGQLDLEFQAVGAVDRVRWPEWLGIGFADGLWQHSCFEAFVGVPDGPAYAEINLATSGRWAVYRFDGYRQGMERIETALIGGGRTIETGEIRVRRSVRLPEFADAPEWRLGLSAVIEGVDGEKSYWALAHPEGRPDFHDEICFAARLAAPAAA